ncbi:DNA adenine methylase [Methanoplanus sp. FWC-SCC4]|uniref:site-specific DNA-methyltransferase (adenine-specific) n=1 Tax=Methanochimaera problematica TaxID=2609417 RepID=A0AA97FB37_9EURY|nr:DNA adenine methylase [Methanoplanus sp. FWC-SCC4]WOF15714.1 DNA adenine methylase [Methanoplanus sp. FWC-SCC4]
MLKPVVKWAGGKRQLIDEIFLRIPEKWNTYYEPFIGGGAVFIHLYNENLIQNAVINDINRELVNLYLTIQENHCDLSMELKSEDFKNDSEVFYNLRDEFNMILGDESQKIRRAALFIYLNRHCFNGLWRENKSGLFNVPFGRYKSPKLPDEEFILSFGKMLERTKIKNEGFESSVAGAKEGDFVYFDPPYMPVSKTADFTSYSSSGFCYNDQKRLSLLFRELSDNGVNVMLSNSNNPEIHQLYSGYNIHVVEARRNINSNPDKRLGASEVIVTNY